MTPRSRGQLRIASHDPHAHPFVDHGYLTDPAGHDIAVMRNGLRIANGLLESIRSLHHSSAGRSHHPQSTPRRSSR